MAVTGPYGVALEVPDLEPGVEFFSDAGLEVQIDGNLARFNCVGRDDACIVLIGGAARKRFHHLVLRADSRKLDELRRAVPKHGGVLVDAPDRFDSTGVWVKDPFDMLIHLVDGPPEPPLAAVERFQINEPGHVQRVNRSGVPPKASIQPVQPLRLGHMLFYTPNVMGSVTFFTDALGMRLTDHSEDTVAFMCTQKNSDHHVVAFARSRGVGFHHISFEVATPDDVGRGGRQLADKARRGDWGFGRHTVGANFFHYIQDPWGSWFEYYADMDYISDHADWTVSNYLSEDSLYNWGPEMPHDFLHNYEADDLESVVAERF